MPPLGNYRQFQFHKGTIKTEVFDMMTTGESHFNSIKVRLKLLYLRSKISLLSFQFHKGTIKTLHPLHHGFLLRNFNSIKVRLKPPVKETHSYKYDISIP